MMCHSVPSRARGAARCPAITRKGLPCRATPLPTRPLCGAHYLKQRRREGRGQPKGWILGANLRPMRPSWRWAA